MFRFCVLFLAAFVIFSTEPLSADTPCKVETETLLRVMTPEKTAYLFSLRAEGFPAGTSVDVVIERLDDSKEFYEDFYVRRDGLVMDAQTEDPGYFTIGLAVQGEPVLVTIIANDKQKAANLVIPYPYEATDKKGHQLTLIRTTKDAKGFFWQGEGFKPKERLMFTSTSVNESGSHPIIANDKGKVEGALMPGVVGLSSGIASIQVTGKDSDLKINYVWGKEGLIDYGASVAVKEVEAKLKEFKN